MAIVKLGTDYKLYTVEWDSNAAEKFEIDSSMRDKWFMLGASYLEKSGQSEGQIFVSDCANCNATFSCSENFSSNDNYTVEIK